MPRGCRSGVLLSDLPVKPHLPRPRQKRKEKSVFLIFDGPRAAGRGPRGPFVSFVSGAKRASLSPVLATPHTRREARALKPVHLNPES
jgi:hypothetical protein